MKSEFQKSIDLAISYSEKPILIIGNNGDGKAAYLKNNYKSYFRSASLDLIENSEKKLPKWYEAFCSLCSENKNKKFLLVFDEFDKLDLEKISNFISMFINAESDKKLLPQNASLVAVANGANSEFSKMYEQYIPYFSVVIGYDKNNVLVDFGDISKNTKTK